MTFTVPVLCLTFAAWTLIGGAAVFVVPRPRTMMNRRGFALGLLRGLILGPAIWALTAHVLCSERPWKDWR